MIKSEGIEKAVLGNAYISLATIFWGVNYPFAKALIPEWMSANAVSRVRLAGGCCLFWLASLFMKTEKLDRESLKKAAIGGAIGLFGCIYLFVLAPNYGRAIDIAIIMTLPPVFVILMEVFFLGRRPSILAYIGVILSFGGAATVILGGGSGGGGGSDYLLGDALAIAASCCFAIYLVTLAKPTRVYSPVSLLRWVFFFAALPALFLSPDLFRSPIIHCDKLDPWLWISFILFCPAFISYPLTQPAISGYRRDACLLISILNPCGRGDLGDDHGSRKTGVASGHSHGDYCRGNDHDQMGHDRREAKK